MSQTQSTQPNEPTPSMPPETAAEERNIYAKEEISMWAMFGILLFALTLAYSKSLQIAMDSWNTELYSHGYLIPFMAAALLWLRREPYRPFPMWQRWVGLGLLTATLLGSYLAEFFAQEFVMQMSFVPAVAFCFLIAGGWPLFRWAGPVCFILFFMFPVYWGLERHMLEPMQLWATTASAFMLQLMGFVATQSGNVITINDIPLNVVGACSGLRMTTIFVALSIFFVLISQRTWWENLIILLCAIPIALIVNIMRITVTGIGYSIFGVGGTAEKLIHDWSGLAMAPMALILLWGVVRLLSTLYYEEEVEENTPIKVFERPGTTAAEAENSKAQDISSVNSNTDNKN
ncbi:MAG: exosortase/archaeosortase family protein [Thermoguttaceae bacterium]|nr:exosortase/archaeosortase family protein [Thermoguttaceae bacterium]MBQ6615367.1 exosortase/archaeosortase family protein [Thermoguttaceae bacterium]